VADGFATPALIPAEPISADPMTAAGCGITASRGPTTGLATPPHRDRPTLAGNWLVVQFMSMNLVTTDDKQLRAWVHEEHHRYFNASRIRAVAEAFDASLSTEVGKRAPRITVRC